MQRTPSGVTTAAEISIGLVCLALSAFALFHSFRASGARSPVHANTTDLPPLAPGTRVPPLEGKNLAGRLVKLDPQGRLPTVIYAFSSSCVWCDRNRLNLNALVESADGRYRFLGVWLGDGASLPNYMLQQPMNIQVLRDVPQPDRIAYHLRPTPELIVVSPAGVVLRDWRGALSGDRKSEVEHFFGLVLPGLAADSQAKGNVQ